MGRSAMTEYRSDHDQDYEYDYDDEFDGEFEEEEPRRPTRLAGRFGVVAGILVLALCGFAGIVWYAYTNARSLPVDGEPPLIQADSTPVRVRPEEPGGIEVPFQDRLVLQRLDSRNGDLVVEHLLPPPEHPLPRPVAETPEPVPPDEGPQPAEAGEEGEDVVIASKAPPFSPPSPERPAIPEPETVEAPRVSPVPTPTEQVAARPPEPAPTPAPPPEIAAPASGGYRVQMASVRSEEAARNEWRRLQSQHPELLGALQLQVQRADLGEKGTYYRVQGGPLSEESAGSVCAALKAKKVDCIVIRP